MEYNVYIQKWSNAYLQEKIEEIQDILDGALFGDEINKVWDYIEQLESDKLELSKAIVENCLVFKYSDWIECVHCGKGTQITDKKSYDNHSKDCIVRKYLGERSERD